MTGSLDGAHRIAVMSDIHGNAAALAAVLDDIAVEQPEATVCLGDMASGPFDAGRAMDMLLAAAPALCVRGNHDRLIAIDRDGMFDSDRLADAVLTDAHRAWLAALPATARSGEIYLCHGTPDSDETFWLEVQGADGRLGLAPGPLVRERMAGITAPVMLCGHSHLPRALRLDGSLIVNPGSVGQPAWKVGRGSAVMAETGTPDAAYAIVEKRGAVWRAVQRYVPYDAGPAAVLAEERGMPGWAVAVRTGRAV